MAQAKRDGYRSRAAYKLIEIDDKHHFLKHGIAVVDLGAAPGGWSQIAAKRVGAVNGKGKVVAIDLLEMPEIPGVNFAQLDFLAEDAPEKLIAMMGGRADVVMSDMAPNTTGHRKTDQLRIVGLIETAAAFATDVLNPGGTFLAKAFQSGADAELVAQLKRDFASVRHVKPASSRQDSSERYVLAMGFRGQPNRREHNLYGCNDRKCLPRLCTAEQVSGPRKSLKFWKFRPKRRILVVRRGLFN